MKEPRTELDEVIGKLGALSLRIGPKEHKIVARPIRDSVMLLLRFRQRFRDPTIRYNRLMLAFTELQQASQKVVDETDRIYDTELPPVKYGAPYAAITELRQLLAKQYGLR